MNQTSIAFQLDTHCAEGYGLLPIEKRLCPITDSCSLQSKHTFWSRKRNDITFFLRHFLLYSVPSQLLYIYPLQTKSSNSYSNIQRLSVVLRCCTSSRCTPSRRLWFERAQKLRERAPFPVSLEWAAAGHMIPESLSRVAYKQLRLSYS